MERRGLLTMRARQVPRGDARARQLRDNARARAQSRLDVHLRQVRSAFRKEEKISSLVSPDLAL